VLIFTKSTLLDLRVEWAKSRARAARWAEEVTLTAEEMRRVLWYLDWKSHWWTAQGKLRTTSDATLDAGLVAYAAKQARVQEQMAEEFATQWLPYHKANSLPVGNWPKSYIIGQEVVVPGAVVQIDEEDIDIAGLDDDLFD
jgi:hypothetical protein